MRHQLKAILSEPRPSAAVRDLSRFDRVFIAVMALSGVSEAFFSQGVQYRALQAIGALIFILPLWWRNSHPFGMFLISFIAASAVPLSALIVGPVWKDLDSTACILILSYNLFRWGSGREALQGLVVLAVLFTLMALRGQYEAPADVVAGAVVLLFPPLLGATLRFRARAQQRELDTARLRERQNLARELHDTVAHHVSAIALQAQGGLALSRSRPESAAEVLKVIDETARKTLSELRTIVGALREGDNVETAPQATLADISTFSRSESPSVTVLVEGSQDSVPVAVQAATYRIVQESVTNARRHAKGATTIRVAVNIHNTNLDLEIVDNGEPPPRGARQAGYGLVGMAERTALLGGAFEAGAGSPQGWRVFARFPLRS